MLVDENALGKVQQKREKMLCSQRLSILTRFAQFPSFKPQQFSKDSSKCRYVWFSHSVFSYIFPTCSYQNSRFKGHRSRLPSLRWAPGGAYVSWAPCYGRDVVVVLDLVCSSALAFMREE